MTEPSAAAAPIFHAGRAGGLGVVLVHGLTASPTEVRPVADFLRERDPAITLSVPLLPGHGTRVGDLRATHPDAWRRTVAGEVGRLAGTCGHVSVVGVSMGAVLAAQAALDDPRVRSIGMLAPVFSVGRWVSLLAPFVRHVMPYRRKSERSLVNHRAKGLCSYDRYPLTSLVHLNALGRRVRARLGELTVPVLLAGGRRDQYVSWIDIESLARAIGSESLELVDCPASGHILPHEPDAEHLFERLHSFLVGHHSKTASVAAQSRHQDIKTSRRG